MSVTPFGEFKGKPVHKISFASLNKNLRASIITYGATIQSLQHARKDSSSATTFDEMILGFDDLQGYLGPGHHGATVGRYSNRIHKGSFPQELVGSSSPVQLPVNNNGVACLHSGPQHGFSTRVWDSFSLICSDANDADSPVLGVQLMLHSPHGESGFSGDVVAVARYFFEGNDLVMDFKAHVSEAPAIISMCNHAYYNLENKNGGGESIPTVMNHELEIPSGKFFVATDKFSIPTGEILSTAGKPLDFTQKKPLARDADLLDMGPPGKAGFDHSLVLSRVAPTAVALLAAPCSSTDVRLFCPASQRLMTVTTSLPAVQVYSSNFLAEGLKGHGGKMFGPRCGLCLETQLFPDTPNHQHFPSCVVKPGI